MFNSVHNWIHPVLSHDIFALQSKGGISRYVAELHRALRKLSVPSTVLAPLHKSDLLRAIDRVAGIYIPDSLQVKGTGRLAWAIGQMSERPSLMLLKRRHAGVVFHKSFYAASLPPPDMPTAITVHDMTHERYPAYFAAKDPTSRRKRLWCERADAVITVSHYTRQQLLHFIDIDPTRVHVCHHGISKIAPDAAVVDRLGRNPPFLLYVGSRRGYKNFSGLIRAYSKTVAAKEGVHLVAFGGGPPSDFELGELKTLGIFHLVTFTHGADSVLASYYATAAALIYPSLDEGFGFPPLEAMQYDCPVIAARAGAIPEIVQDAALLVDPTEDDELREAIDNLLGDNTLQRRLITLGATRVRHFSWENTAKTTLDAYKAALRHDGGHS